MTDSSCCFQPRNGLAELGGKLSAASCRIAYLGASVTAQTEGYRPLLHERLVQRFGQPHQAINAGFGGVGCISGVFTMDAQVLAHQPDLCFIEFSSGDMGGWTPVEEIGPAVEGMIRKLTAIGCMVCLIYAYRADQCFDVSNTIVAEYEKVAEHYGIPSINVGRFLETQVADGTFTTPELLRDAVHTTLQGSEVMVNCIETALGEMFSVTGAKPVPRVALHTRNFEHTGIVLPTIDMLRDKNSGKTGRFRFTYDYLQVDAANEILFMPPGELIGLFVIVGKDSGFIEVETGSGVEEYSLWDPWCHYHRINTVIFRQPIEAGTSCNIRLTDKTVNYADCRRTIENTDQIRKHLTLLGFLVRHKTDSQNTPAERAS